MTVPDLYRTDLFVPTYRPLAQGAWSIRTAELLLCKGYWSPAQLVTGMVGLSRDGATWMSLTPMEMESQEIGIRQAWGDVVIFGLGLGWAAAATALQDAVRSVTVVEYDEDVLALHRALDIFSQLPAEARAKVRIEQGDAYRWKPAGAVDLLMPDIWLPLISDGRIEEVRAMQANVGAAAIYFWGQEMELARHAVAAGRALDEAGIRATVADWSLPLIGPAVPGYCEKLNAAARQWMFGRWLPGSAPPF